MNKRKRSIAEEASVSPTREASHNNYSHHNSTTNNNTSPVGPELNEALPAITRRITACAACRKQKVCFPPLVIIVVRVKEYI